MSKRKIIIITNKDMRNKLKEMSLSEVLDLLNTYSSDTGEDTKFIKSKLITNDLQNRLLNNEINTKCPYCNSEKIVKKGLQNNIHRFKCKDCNKYFTLFTNTILEKTKYHWDVWIAILQMTLNYISIDNMVNILRKDYKLTNIDRRTVMYWRHKLIHALANITMPKLSGIIEVDETFMRESQKGEQELYSFIKGEVRNPRYGRKPSSYGIMGPEWATITTMVNHEGYCVCKVTGLGKLSKEVFTDMFDSYIDNPSYICSDSNRIYRDYCKVKGYELYIRPSDYLIVIYNNGYKTPDYTNPTLAVITEENNQKILSKLYEKELIDYIYNKKLSYKEFEEIKKLNNLGLGRVNQLHNDIKEHFNKKMRNVNTKYLEDYIGFFTYIRNWKVTNGYYPSSLEDAENIFIEILKGKSNYKVKEQKEKILELPIPSDKYVKLLKEYTIKAQTVTKNPYFKYDNEDNVIGFNKREFLEDLPKVTLNKLRAQYKIPRSYVKYSVISTLLKQPDIEEQIIKIITTDRHIAEEEDIQYLKKKGYL